MPNPDLIILTHESAAYTRQVYKGMQTSIEMCSILATSEHLVQQECTECNHCVHLSILHIQCVPNPDLIILTHESAAYTRQVYKGMQTSIEMCSILATSEHLVQQECTECNHCVHLSILHIQCVPNPDLIILTHESAAYTRQVYKGMQTSIEMCSILATSEHLVQQECTECNHCVHLSILHIQCVPNPDLIILTHESAAYTRQVYKGMQTSIEMCSILATSEHLVQQECTECNHCVHLSILHIQMYAKSRSNHTHS